MAIDCEVFAGENQPVAFVFPETFDPEGKSYELVVEGPHQRWTYTEATGLSRNGRTITWIHSLADSRAFPEGRIATLHLQWTQGAVQMGDRGMLTVIVTGNND